MRPSLDRIGPNFIDIWRWSLDPAPCEIDRLFPMLSGEEKARASRFVYPEHRQHFIAGRAGLRLVLGHYLHLPPHRIGLTYNVFGKPRIAGASELLHFNLSHSADVAMLAVSDHYPVGIDVEAIKPLKEDIAGHFFSKRECAALAAFAGDDYLNAFYRCWTRKEAFVKAHGAGLSLPLDSFDVTVDAASRPRLESLDGDRDAPLNWSLFDLASPPGFAGTLAALTLGNAVHLRYSDHDVLALKASVAHPAHTDPRQRQNGGSRAIPV
ncbi:MULTISPECIES: 4'-phosphopantetheinyl transferase superfamily protein [Ensifer]|uniref:4'-phosphopantetheinyl transferase family protein n=1 Tax=Ensifer TaxID=106591 RepID=UPI00046C8F4F|nr:MULTISPECIES: 4'-phosphopantetheinyl transferase superfamily protein [Ensifer]MDP9633530.1 4'-phosphopantetheinyl transferase [Ensifer adhaerens]